jgi:sodium pump decarboxylase gamma subunit
MTITELLAQFANPETIKTLSITHKLLAGLVTTLLGMGITFIALILLQILISSMDRLINRGVAPKDNTQANQASVKKKSDVHEAQDDNELVAVITGVIAMQLKTSVDTIVIKNIAKIEDRSPLWNRAGIIEQMNTRL